MKVNMGPSPAPLTSMMAVQTRVDPPVRAPDAPAPSPAPTPKSEAAEPIVLNMGGTKFEVTAGELAKVIEKMNETARIFNTTMRFEVADGHRIKVRVLDSSTGQLIREIPPEDVMNSFSRLQDVIGVLLDQRA